ncbi:MAG: YHYH domain-containing protein [Alphaproteobacteria bacterium]
MRHFLVMIVFVITSFWLGQSFAHSGRTNAKGCHTNHKTGDYHCHRKKKP